MTGCLCRIVLSIMMVILGIAATCAAAEAGEESLTLSARAAVLIDGHTGLVLYGYNATRPLPPASTTKVLTGILGLELGSISEPVHVDYRSAGIEGTTIYLQGGDVYRLCDLIKGALISSGNDSASAIAIHLAGDEKKFSALMNYKAQTLGCLASRFGNPHGLPQTGHLTTSYDLAVITRYSMQNGLFRSIVGTKSGRIRERSKGEVIPLYNTNRLLGHEEMGWRITGVKTGTTSEAGQCLIAAAEKNDQMLISVVLGSSDRYADTLRVLEYGIKHCHPVLVRRREPLREVPVWRGSRMTVAVAPEKDISLLIPPRLLPFLEKRIYLEPYLKAPCARGRKVGRMEILLGNKVLFQTDLVTLNNVPRG